MHHYSTTAWATLANIDSPGEVTIWRQAIPGEARRHDFLMDSLLAFSAFHLAYLEPSSNTSYLTMGTQYQSRSLHGLMAALDHLDDNNPDALFASSLIVTTLTFFTISSNLGGTDLTPAQSLQSISKLLQGTAAIHHGSNAAIRSGIFSSVLKGGGAGPVASHGFVHEDGLEQGMAKLRERVDQMAKYISPAQHQIYMSCLASLQNAFEHVSAYRKISVIISWPVIVDGRLMELFQQNDPMAQLIWMHYGILLLHIDHHWWGEGFGVGLICSLSEELHSLDNDWTDYTRWALECAWRVKGKKGEEVMTGL